MQSMQRTLACLLALVLMTLPFTSARAAMVGTGDIVAPAADRAQEAPLRQFLAREDARRQLQQLGVGGENLEARIASLSDSELAQINQGIDNLHAGGTSVLGVVVLIFVIFVITDVIGATDIFPFIHPVR